MFLNFSEDITLPKVVKLAEETYQIFKQQKYFYYEGYAYKHEKSRGDRSYWHCCKTRSTCKARLVVVNKNEKKIITTFKDHNHPISDDKNGKLNN